MQNVGVGEKLFEGASEIQAPRMENSRREKRAVGCVASLSRRGEYGSEVERQREKEKMQKPQGTFVLRRLTVSTVRGRILLHQHQHFTMKTRT